MNLRCWVLVMAVTCAAGGFAAQAETTKQAATPAQAGATKQGGATKQAPAASPGATQQSAAGQKKAAVDVPKLPTASTTKSAEVSLRATLPYTFVAFGDLRETDVSNHADSDPEKRQAILKEIARQNPKFVLVSGDLVLAGESKSDWAQWDTETAELKKNGIEILPALGNHDLWRVPEVALENYWPRFPQLRKSRYYSARAEELLVLSLDSAQPTTSGAQFEWLKEKLEKVPKNVGFVVVLIHHPPMTRSMDRATGGGHSVRGPEAALGQYLESVAAKMTAKIVVIAGHVHNYERYERNKVNYIVSGGGGATPYPIPRRMEDAYRDPGPSYHFLKVDVTPEHLRIGMEKLVMINGKPVWSERDSLVVPNDAPHSIVNRDQRLPKE